MVVAVVGLAAVGFEMNNKHSVVVVVDTAEKARRGRQVVAPTMSKGPKVRS